MKTTLAVLRLPINRDKFSAYLLLFLISITSQAQEIRWQTDNNVYSSVMVDNTLYLGGNFTYIGKYTGTTVMVPEATGNAPVAGTPKLNVSGLLPSINSVIPDGSGGYYVAGSITYVDESFSTPASQVMHILNNSGIRWVDWAIRTSGRVNCLYLSGSTLYIGGAFSSVAGSSGSMTRRNIAAINAGNGNVTTWNPAFGTTGTGVFSIVGSGSVVYAGGGFTFGSFTNLAAINATTGASAWATPNNPNQVVRALALSGTTLFVGGDFATIGATSRKAVAAVNAADGTIISGFNAGTSAPGGTNNIRSMIVSADGSLLYVGGSFSGFQSRNNLLALNTGTGMATGFNPNPIDAVNSIDLSTATNRLYVAGAFKSTSGGTTIGGRSRNFIAALNIATGQDDNAWVTLCNGIVNYVSIAGGYVFMGGEFTSAGGAARNRLAAFDYITNTLLPWNPDADATVRTLIHYRQRIYAGGDFNSIGGQPLQKIASLDMNSGMAVGGWSADANSTVRTLYGSNGRLYAGGDFTMIGGQSRNRIAKLDIATGAVITSWNPGTDNIVRAISGYSQKIYAAGDFNTIGGQTRSKIAAIDSGGTGPVNSWYPAGGATGTTSSVPSRVNALAVSNGIVYAGGSFATMGGQSLKNIAAIDDNGAILSGFSANPNSANEVDVIYPSGNYLYVGGSFNDMKTNTLHKHLSEMDKLTGTPTSGFYASPGADVYTVAVSGNIMYFGGAFPNYIPDQSYPVGRNSFLSFHVSNGSLILPVHIGNFSVQQQHDIRFIRWTAANDATAGTVFEVQRSNNNLTYLPVVQQAVNAFVPVHSYEVKDNEPLKTGTYYYRLKITEPAGEVSYSSIQAIKINSDNGTRVVATVIDKGQLFVKATSGDCSIYLSNQAGQITGIYPLQAGLNTISTSHLSKGIYLYSIISFSGESLTRRKTTGKIIVR